MARKTTLKKAARAGRKKRAAGRPGRRAKATPGRSPSPGRKAGGAKAKGARARRKRPASRAKRILVVDDHPVVRRGLAMLLEQEPGLEVCGEAEDTTRALEALAGAEADLAVVDLSLKRGSGLELVKKIKARFPHLPVLVFSRHEESIFAERALKAGASGYVMKREAPAEVVAAIRRVLEGSIHVSEKVAERIVLSSVRAGPSKGASPVELLSDRELEVFQLIGRGLGTRQVAEALYLSVDTVETYRQRIKGKLGLKSAAELVHRAIERAQSERPG